VRFADAIRLGAMMRPQAHGAIFEGGKSCAMGAALEAAGVRFPINSCDYDQHLWRLYETLQWPLGRQTRCPACLRATSVTLGWLVTHLNDDHLWTREEIAAFVDTVDPAPVTSAPQLVSV
jgi:hypothetical protein